MTMGKLTVEGLVGDLENARKIINGVGASPDMLTDELFPTLAQFYPEKLILLRKLAEMSGALDEQRLEMFTEVGSQVWAWQDEKERNLLLAAAQLGDLNKAWRVIENEHGRRIQDGTNERPSGFRK